MHRRPTPEVTMVVRVRDDEELVGHAIMRIARHLRGLGQSFELLVADESSGDNSVAIATLLRREFPEVAVLHAAVGHGFYAAAQRARGRALVLIDARTRVPLPSLTSALTQLRRGHDVVIVEDRFLVLRRTRTWRAFGALITPRRRPRILARRLAHHARGLSLRYVGPPPIGRFAGLRAGLRRCLAILSRPLVRLARPRPVPALS